MKKNVRTVEKYESIYGDHMAIASDSLQKKFKYEWRDEDTLAIGKSMDNWKDVMEVMESDQTTMADLGPVLNQNLGLVTMQYGTLPIQNISSVQPIDDVSGSVFYRTAIAETERAGVKVGDQLMGAFGKTANTINHYMSDTQTVLVPVTTGTFKYTGVKLEKNVVPGSVSVVVGSAKGFDDGEGHLVGATFKGKTSVVDYAAGTVTIDLDDDLGGLVTGGNILVTYKTNVTEGRNVPSFKWTMLSKNITARFYVLQSTYNSLTSFQVRKKFGQDTSVELASDLIAQANAAVMTDTVNNLVSAARANEVRTGKKIVWSNSAPTGVSDSAYRQSFDDKIIEAVDSMHDSIGRGGASFYVVNTQGKQVLKSLGMTIINDNATAGVSLCGFYDGAPVYYAPNTALTKSEMLVGYRGTNWYESAAVYSPYMPVTNETGSSRDNVFEKLSGIASASGNEVLVPEFVVRITFA